MSSTGIDFVIGGKDNASTALSSTEKSLKRLERSTEALSSKTSLLTNVTLGLTAAYAAVKGAAAILGGLDAINIAYDKQSDAVRELNNGLSIQGANVDAESARLREFASNMQRLTGVGDEVTLGLLRQAQTMGVATDQLDDMARAGIGLGEAMGVSAESGMDMMRQAQQRNFDGLERMFPQMKFMQSMDQKMAFASELAARGLDMKAEASEGVAGTADRAAGAMGDLMESVGAIIAPIRILVNQGIKVFAESLQSIMVPAVEFAEETLANIGPMMDWVAQKVVDGVNIMVGVWTFFEVILTNLGDVWEIVKAAAELGMLKISENVKYYFNEVIPAYLDWFVENLPNIFVDAFSAAYTVVTNHVMKIVDALAALWMFVETMGGSDVLGSLGEIAGRSYLEGFKSTITSLPEIAVRELTGREEELAEKMGKLGGKLGDEFSKKMKERTISVDKITDAAKDDLTKDIDLKFDKQNLGASATQAAEGRLLTRGPQTQRLDKLIDLVTQVVQNTSKTTRMVPLI